MMSLSALRDALALLLKFPPEARIELDRAPSPLRARSVGDAVRVTVKADLVNGRSVIEIDGAPFDVRLPMTARPGDTLRLQVLAVTPRLTLAVLPTGADGVSDQVAMSESAQRLSAVLDRLLGKTPDAASPARPPAAAAESPLEAGATSAGAPGTSTPPVRGGAAADPMSGPALPSTREPAAAAAPAVTAEATPLKRAAAVLEGAPADRGTFAAALKAALSRSGLFYESHQAQWVTGERPLPDLMREPQASLSRATEPVHPQVLGLVRQQLEILDTRQLVWSGQVWPDQSMEWRIEEDRPQATAAPDEARQWKTSLRLTLPRLGAITAALSIQGDDVRIAFRDVSADTGSALAGEWQALRGAFERAGLQLVDVKMERDEA